MHYLSAAGSVALSTLALGFATTSAPAATAPDSCVPTGGKVMQTADSATVWQYAGGPLMACGAFGDPIELATGPTSNFFDSGSRSTVWQVANGCALVTSEGGNYRYQSLSYSMSVVDLVKRTRATALLEIYSSAPSVTKAVFGPSCSAAFLLESSQYLPKSVIGLDSRGQTRAPEGTSVEEYATTLQGPPAPTTPVEVSKGGAKLSSKPTLSRSRSKTTLTLRYGRPGKGEYPQGITVLVAGQVISVDKPRDHGYKTYPRRIDLTLGSNVSSRLRSGRSYQVKVISCAYGCVEQAQTVKVVRR